MRERELLTEFDYEYQKSVSNVDNVTVDDLMRCIAELPDTFRTVFNLFAVEGYRHQEIAEMLNIPESTSRSYFFRARRLLQEKVTKLTDK